MGKKGEPILSAEAGIVTIPEKEDAKGEVLAMVQEPGEASSILQQPEAVLTPKAEPESVSKAEEPKMVEPEAETPAKAEEVASVEPEPSPKPDESEKVQVAVKAVDVEASKVFIAGTGEPGRQVRVYINDEYKGTAKVNPFGNFLLELNETLGSGNHDLRVDMLEEGAGEVASRVAVVVDHQSEEVPQTMAEIAKPEAEPAPVVEEAPPVKSADVKMDAEIIKPAVEANVPAQLETQVAAVEPVSEQPVANQPTAEATEPEVIKTGRSVIIRSGDSLWQISRRMLGQGRKYTTIFSANANKIKDPHKIYPGQVFDIPDEETVQQSEKQG